MPKRGRGGAPGTKGRGKGRGRGGDVAVGSRPMMMPAVSGGLETVFAKEGDDVLGQQKRDATRSLDRKSDGWDVGHGARVFPYPCHVEGEDTPVIDIPIRPSWHADMSVEALNEQEAKYFESWLREIYQKYPKSELNFFEHNLEVWRQVWRTIERADIVMMTVDCRLPAFHFSKPVYNWIRTNLHLDVVLVLNKADMVPPAHLQLWKGYFAEHLPDVPVVDFTVPKSGSVRVGQLPCVQRLLQALRKCSVTRNGKRVPADPFFDLPEETSERNRDEYITVVLQGDPNMGKSSVINAVFGEKLVSSSATPGHTKHFQTLFLSRGVCFCDSPGIVCPKLNVPKALQVIFGSFRIAQVREPYHVVRFIAERCYPPLQDMLKLHRFRDEDDEPDDPWSPIGICEAYARKRGFFRRGGRPDPFRAANRLLRDALNGFNGVVLAFAPPGTNAGSVAAAVATCELLESSSCVHFAREVMSEEGEGSDEGSGDNVDSEDDARSGDEGRAQNAAGPDASASAGDESGSDAEPSTKETANRKNVFALLSSGDSESEDSEG